MHVRATVVSLPTGDRAIIDAGSKVLTREQYYVKNFGKVVEYPGAVVANLSEEHGIIDFSARREAAEGRRGGQHHPQPLLRRHATCIDEVYGIRGDEVEVDWPVAARGKLT